MFLELSLLRPAPTGVANPPPSWIPAGTTPLTLEHILEWSSQTGESIPLTAEELADIHTGITEIESAKSKRFTKLKDALEWLNRE